MGTATAPVVGSGALPAWMQSVEKPIDSFRELFLEDSLVRIPLRPVREERDDRLAGSEPLGDLERACRGRAGGTPDEQALLRRELAARVEGLRVVDHDDFVDERTVQD